MSSESKQISNPFSTGGGGIYFETRVQSLFVALMLTGGFAPCLPCCPITRIKLQGRFAGFNTDDMIVYMSDTSGKERKLLGQIKHTISITESEEVFREVIQAAWNDYSNPDIFTKNEDVFALITGPLSVTDINDTRTILEWARASGNADEFFTKVKLARFSSKQKKKKLDVFKLNLKKANKEKDIPNEIIFDFLKHFNLIGYDLDIKSGVTLSLLHSIIGQYSQDNAESIWTRIVDEVQSANKNAGTITMDMLPVELQNIFGKKEINTIPSDLPKPEIESISPDWTHHKYAVPLSISVIAGAWNEQNQMDCEIVGKLAGENYESWIVKLREILHESENPLDFRNGRWNIKNRINLWDMLGSRIFGNNLDTFKECAIKVLAEYDPQFDLKPE
ncbi:MAG: hypothetical protein JW881_12020 [Spirochaetales bacterium]|nr:hypothetical protein [Spirochaetales bacterium]